MYLHIVRKLCHDLRSYDSPGFYLSVQRIRTNEEVVKLTAGIVHSYPTARPRGPGKMPKDSAHRLRKLVLEFDDFEVMEDSFYCKLCNNIVSS